MNETNVVARRPELRTSVFRAMLAPAASIAGRWRTLVALMVTAFSPWPAGAQTSYKIINLPTPAGYNSAAMGLNANGDIVGYSFQGDQYHAFLYSQSAGSSIDLGSLGGKTTAACAINESGQVTGYSQDGNGNLLGFIYTKEDGIKALGTLDGGVSSEAFGLNGSGQAVGDSQNATDDHRPVVFGNGSVTDPNVCVGQNSNLFRTAYGINDAEQIVGRTDTSEGAIHAFLLASPSGGAQDLGTLGGVNSEALAINQSGEVVGDSETAKSAPHAFLYRKGSVRDLGTLPGFDTASYARSINDEGAIVGDSENGDQKRAFVDTNGQMSELDKLTTNLSQAGFKSLDVAYGINHHGWIVGYGTATDGRTIAFLAIPQTEGEQPQQPPVQTQAQAPEGGNDDYSVFYTQLSSDGDWVEAGDYGYVFHPRASEGDWAPYRDGHWVWTDRGWFWYSNEHFGWATYHYGRWVRIAGAGWCWVPGQEWAPAWVSWRESDDYVGWAPLPPTAAVSVSIGIAGWADTYYGLGPNAYSFINYRNWSQPSYLRVIAPPAQNVQIINQTRNITNIRVQNNVINNYGPAVATIAQRTNQKIVPTNIVFNGNRGGQYGTNLRGNQLQVAAPAQKLRAVAPAQPAVKTRLAKVEVDNGWKNIDPAQETVLRKQFAEQNPVPKELPPKPALVKPAFAQEAKNPNAPGQGSGQHPAAGTPPQGPGQRTVTGAQPANRRQQAGWNAMPPNLIGSKKEQATGFQKTLSERNGPGGAVTPQNESERLQGVGRPPGGGVTPVAPGPVERKATPGGGVTPVPPGQVERKATPGGGGTPNPAQPNREEKPKSEGNPKKETPPRLEGTPKAGQPPVGTEIKRPEAVPANQGPPKQQSLPKVEETKKEGAPKNEGPPKQEHPPRVEETKKQGAAPRNEGVPKQEHGGGQEGQKPENQSKEKNQGKGKEKGSPTP